jgi:hypothetical protein
MSPNPSMPSMNLAGCRYPHILDFGRAIGAPEAFDGLEKLPHAAPVQPAPDSVQVTTVFWLS